MPDAMKPAVPTASRAELTPKKVAFKITLSYAVFAALWIIFSDQAMGWLVRDPAELVRFSSPRPPCCASNA
jgi:hypothetical protein